MVRFLCFLLVLVGSSSVTTTPVPKNAIARCGRKIKRSPPAVKPSHDARAADPNAPITREEMQDLFAKALSQR